MKFKTVITTLLLMALLVGCAPSDRVNLAGEWSVSLDSLATIDNRPNAEAITLPGTTDGAGFGVASDAELGMTTENLTFLTRKHSFVGAAWYERTFDIPALWSEGSVELKLERVLWRSDVWINGDKVEGFEESLIAPHRYEVGKYLKAGKNTIVIKVDNRKQHSNSVRDLAHAYTNHTQTIWNGVIGDIELIHSPSSSIEGARISTDYKNHTADFDINIVAESDETCEISYDVVLRSSGESHAKGKVAKTLTKGDNTINIETNLGDKMALWSEFTPEVYDVKFSAKFDNGSIDELTDSFGVRTIATDGNKMTINGTPLFLRGTLECCIFPLTGCPPMDRASWSKLFTTAREWGLNHLRFHSWCPPKAAFEVADEMGFYLQVELPFWTLDIGKDAASVDFMRNEGDRILAEYGNHPSFTFMCMGNELEGDFTVLADLMKRYKAKDNRRLYTTTAFTFKKGHGVGPEAEDDYFTTQWTKRGWVRGQGVFNQKSPTFNNHYAKAIEGVDVPLVTHEIGQYSVYPQISEIEKYTGVLDPINFKSIKADLEQKGLLDRAEEYTYSSGRFASILYKEEIERALKTDGISGYQLLDLHDFPGQGTALVGLLDAFWDSKGVISAERFREFSNPVTPLLYFPKATYTSAETFKGEVAISNFGAKDMKDVVLAWSAATEEGETIAEGEISANDIKLGFNGGVGEIEFSLSNVVDAARVEIVLSIENSDYRNRWSVWSYPAEIDVEFGEVKYTRDYEEAKQLLADGEKVLYNPDWKKLKGIEGKFVPVFWSPVHFPKQAGTMGLLTNPSNPALRNFPTDCHTDWQWWDLNINSTTMIVDSLKGGEPIVEMIDNFANNRRLASIYEGAVGDGKLVISSIDLDSDLDNRIVARQMLYSLVEYMNSAEFAPSKLENFDAVESFLKSSGDSSKEDATSIY